MEREPDRAGGDGTSLGTEAPVQKQAGLTITQHSASLVARVAGAIYSHVYKVLRFVVPWAIIDAMLTLIIRWTSPTSRRTRLPRGQGKTFAFSPASGDPNLAVRALKNDHVIAAAISMLKAPNSTINEADVLSRVHAAEDMNRRSAYFFFSAKSGPFRMAPPDAAAAGAPPRDGQAATSGAWGTTSGSNLPFDARLNSAMAGPASSSWVKRRRHLRGLRDRSEPKLPADGDELVDRTPGVSGADLPQFRFNNGGSGVAAAAEDPVRQGPVRSSMSKRPFDDDISPEDALLPDLAADVVAQFKLRVGVSEAAATTPDLVEMEGTETSSATQPYIPSLSVLDTTAAAPAPPATAPALGGIATAAAAAATPATVPALGGAVTTAATAAPPATAPALGGIATLVAATATATTLALHVAATIAATAAPPATASVLGGAAGSARTGSDHVPPVSASDHVPPVSASASVRCIPAPRGTTGSAAVGLELPSPPHSEAEPKMTSLVVDAIHDGTTAIDSHASSLGPRGSATGTAEKNEDEEQSSKPAAPSSSTVTFEEAEARANRMASMLLEELERERACMMQAQAKKAEKRHMKKAGKAAKKAGTAGSDAGSEQGLSHAVQWAGGPSSSSVPEPRLHPAEPAEAASSSTTRPRAPAVLSNKRLGPAAAAETVDAALASSRLDGSRQTAAASGGLPAPAAAPTTAQRVFSPTSTNAHTSTASLPVERAAHLSRGSGNGSQRMTPHAAAPGGGTPTATVRTATRAPSSLAAALNGSTCTHHRLASAARNPPRPVQPPVPGQSFTVVAVRSRGRRRSSAVAAAQPLAPNVLPAGPSPAAGGYCAGRSSAHPAAVVAASRGPGDSDDDERVCIVCMEHQRSVLLLPCGHLVMCGGCLLAVQTKSGACPMCRTPISSAYSMDD